MRSYLDLIRHVLDNGVEKRDRTETGTIGIFGHQMRFDLSRRFPLLTTKRLHLKSIVYELLSQVTGLEPGDFIHTLGDAHLYLNHTDQAKEQLERKPRDLPAMRLNPHVSSIFDFQFEDFQLTGYNPHPHISAPVAI